MDVTRFSDGESQRDPHPRNLEMVRIDSNERSLMLLRLHDKFLKNTMPDIDICNSSDPQNLDTRVSLS